VTSAATSDADAASWRARALAAEARNEQLAAQVERLTATVATLSGLLFGDSSEKKRPGPQPGGAGGRDGGDDDGGRGGGQQRRPKGKRGQRPGSPGHGRRSYPRLETEVHIIDLDPQERRCRCCGAEYEFLDFEDSEQIDWRVILIRLLFRRRRYRRRCQCPDDEAGPRAVCAPRAPKVIPKGLFTAQFLARLAYEKYVLGRPVHRIIAALAADGLDVAEGTLTGALKQIAPLLFPWTDAIREHVAAAGYVRAGETGWRVFAETPGKDSNRWWLWAFLADDATLFIMDPSRGAVVPATVLGIDRDAAVLEAGRRLVISSDFYGACQSLGAVDGVDPIWCFAHLRRYFLRAGAAHPEALGDWCDAWTQRIAQLYRAHAALRAATITAEADGAITAEADGAIAADADGAIGSADPERERALARYHRAFDNIDAARILQSQQTESMHPAAAKVIATLSREWDGLARHRDMPGLDLDNNASERALRTPVIGRKNFYGSGAAWAATLAADIWTITATAAQNGIEPLHELTEYLTACAANSGKPLTGDQLGPFLPWTPAGQARHANDRDDP
jgi:transposase